MTFLPRQERPPWLFTEVYKHAWITDDSTTPNLMPLALRQIDDPFTDSTTARFTFLTEATSGTFAISGGTATISHPQTGAAHMDAVVEGSAINMPQAMAMVDVLSISGTNGGFQTAILGFIKDSNNYIVANWNVGATTSNISIQTKITGTNTFSSSASLAIGTGVRLGVSLVGTWMTIYSLSLTSGSPTSGATWQKVLSIDIKAQFNPKTSDLSGWKGCFGFSTPSSHTNTNVLTVDNFRVGRFGGVGLRDINVVTNEDGTPYRTGLADGQVYALATLSGAGGQILEASQGVFVVDTNKKTLTQTGIIMVTRTVSSVSTNENDHAGHMIVESNGDQHLCMSTWGDSDVNPQRILHKLVTSGTNLLASGAANVISSMTQLSLTELPSGGGQYDPFLVKIGSTWYMAYTATPTTANTFYPVLDSSPDLSTWTNVGKDTTATQHEGTRIFNWSGSYYVLCGGPSDMKFYDLTMTYKGIINVIPPGAGGTQPHPMIFGFNNLLYLVTFDDTKWPVGGVNFSWGNVRIFASPRY